MAEIKFSQLTTAAQLTNDDIFALAQMQGGSLSSVKTSMIAVANFLNTQVQYTTAYNTQAKTTAGAINELKQLISLIPQFAIEVVEELPTEDISDTTIYLIPAADPETGNYYEEYIHVNDAWELVGTTAVDLSAYYTKLEVDAKFSALATVATSGSYNDLTNKPDLSALMDVNETTFTNPYTKKLVPSGKYTEKLKKLIGASVVWNQLVKNGNFSDNTQWSKWHSTLTANNNEGEITITDVNSAIFQDIPNLIEGHKILVCLSAKIDDATNMLCLFKGSSFATITGTTYTRISKVLNVPSSGNGRLQFTINGTTGQKAYIKNVMVIDLTQMFGSTIADYVYTLETQTAGSGIAWLKSYGFFTEDYYAYSANTMQSVSVSAKVNKDSEDTTISTVALDHTTLRGLFKLDANNNLYADGDEYLPSGGENVRYEERAYQSGDESLANAITDGTTTVVKKSTATTATLTPYTSLQNIESGGTEEFIDYGVEQGTRDVAIPVGNESVYGDNELMGKVVNYIND